MAFRLMVNWRSIGLAFAILLILLSASYYYRMSERAAIRELKILWPTQSEVEARWCGVNSTHRFLESALISCRRGECYSLVRYLIYFPTDDELEEEIPLEVRQNGAALLRTNVTAFKRNYTLFIQTVALIVRMPEGSEVSVMNLSLRPGECLEHKPEPPQVIRTKGVIDDWITLSNGARVHRIFDDLYAATWRGNATLTCGSRRVDLGNLNPSSGDIAIISLNGKCELEINGVKSALGS